MGNINWTRVVLGGLLAGVIIDASESLINGVLFAEAWSNAMSAMGRSTQLPAFSLVLFNLWGLGIGIMTVWVYSAMRPRFGPGPKTALLTALTMWVVAYALAGVTPVALGMVPKRLMAIITSLGLIEITIAALAGAAIYKEKEEAAFQARSAAAAR